MYETIVNGVRYCFYDDHMTINDTALRYEYLSNIQNRKGDDPAFLFDYKGRTFSMPYSPDEYDNIRPYMDKAAQTSPKADAVDAIPLTQVSTDPAVQAEPVIQAEPVVTKSVPDADFSYSMPQGQPAPPKKKKSKKGCLIGIFILLVIILVGCIGLAGSDDSEPADTDNDVAVEEQQEEPQEEQSDEQDDDGLFEDLFDEEKEKPATYKSIYKKYKKKIEKKAPKLVDEYNRECSGLSLEEKAELSNDKISILAEIETEGTEKMAEVMLENGDDYEIYEDWAGKLYDVYEEEAGKITDAYMDSAM